MIDPQHTSRMLQRTVTQMMRTGISAGAVAGLLVLTLAVRPMGAQQPTAVRIPTSVLEKYAGEYVYANGTGFKVSISGDTLFQEVPGRRTAYRPLSETLFLLSQAFSAEFVIDQAGGVTQILTDGVAIEFRARRKGSPPEPPAPAPAAVRVPRKVLQRYAGVYEYLPGQMDRTDLKLVVALSGDTLIRMMYGGQALVPESETRFRVAGTSLVTEFVVDEAGVTAILGSGVLQMLARKPPKR